MGEEWEEEEGIVNVRDSSLSLLLAIETTTQSPLSNNVVCVTQYLCCAFLFYFFEV